VSRIAGVALAVAQVLGSATAVAAPSGRVVRVERSGASRIAPQLCEIHGDTGTCVGGEPRPGQSVVVLDERRVLAELTVVEVSSFSSCAIMWTVTVRPLRGAAGDADGLGVIAAGLDPARAHLIERSRALSSPSGAPGDEVWRAIDGDGDGDADILITRYHCDGLGRPATPAVARCVDLWARTGARMTRTAQLNLSSCKQ
jgi:hypothetical protein